MHSMLAHAWQPCNLMLIGPFPLPFLQTMANGPGSVKAMSEGDCSGRTYPANNVNPLMDSMKS